MEKPLEINDLRVSAGSRFSMQALHGQGRQPGRHAKPVQPGVFRGITPGRSTSSGRIASGVSRQAVTRRTDRSRLPTLKRRSRPQTRCRKADTHRLMAPIAGSGFVGLSLLVAHGLRLDV